jgi:Fe-S oxidoreductase
VPVVVLEPSCAAVFCDELRGLFPEDEDARRLGAQIYLLSEFLQARAPDFRPPALHRKAVVHGHCHHKAIMGMEAEERTLKQLGLDYHILDSGCCGMAGSFGFEPGDHYDVSIKAGERVLLPAVREARKDALIVADGFSCREQIAQMTDRRALHPAQVLRMALDGGPGAAAGDYPETVYGRQPAAQPLRWLVAAAGLLAAGGVLELARMRRRRR